MAAAFFQSGPVELVANILQSCDTPADVLALRSTCRHARRAWLAQPSRIIWSVWSRERPWFNLALIAVRATEIVKTCENQGQLPPKKMNLDELSACARKPSITDLRAVLGLHHFVRAVEIQLCRSSWIQSTIRSGRVGDGSNGRSIASGADPELAERMPDWTLQVHRAIYLTLILGAALAGVYQEPLFRARSADDPELRALSGYSSPTTKQLRFLKEFTVCKTQTTPREEKRIFESLAQWLTRAILSDNTARQAHRHRFEKSVGRALKCKNADDCPVHLADYPDHSDGHLLVWHLMQALWMHGWVTRYLPNHYSHDSQMPREEYRGSRVEIVPFGDFVVQAIGVPRSLSRDTSPTFTRLPVLDAHGVSRDSDEPEEGLVPSENARLLAWLHDYSRQPNSIVDREHDTFTSRMKTPPLHFKFFEYVLYRLDLVIDDGAFWDDPGGEMELTWEEFVKSWGIFTLDDEPGRTLWNHHQYTYQSADILDGSEMLAPDLGRPDLVYTPPN